jgi:hypothetical protein
MLTFQRECGLVLGDDVLIDVAKGTTGGVQSNFFNVWNYFKKNKFERLTLIHTHPDGFGKLSTTDHDMIKGWLKTFNIPIFSFVITNCVVEETLIEQIITGDVKGFLSFYHENEYICNHIISGFKKIRYPFDELIKASVGIEESYELLQNMKYKYCMNTDLYSIGEE